MHSHPLRLPALVFALAAGLGLAACSDEGGRDALNREGEQQAPA